MIYKHKEMRLKKNMNFIGAHIKREKTLSDTIKHIIENKGNALQIFASNPRGTKITSLNKKFFDIIDIKIKNFALIIHLPYTINLAMPAIYNKRIIDLKDCYWIQIIINELKIADLIGALGCVVHCGKHTSNTPENGLKIMKNALEFIIEEMMNLKIKAKIILETSCGQGTELISNYKDFLDFYNSFNDEQKEFLKICIDTCHIWAAGHELSEVYELTKTNDNLKDVMVIHFNNSKNPKNSHLDRHEIIDKGHIPLDQLLKFIKLFRKFNTIVILEMPDENRLAEEFKMIKT